MNILHIVGARPQFIKAHILDLELQRCISSVSKSTVFFTCQHYSNDMSLEIIRDLGLKVDYLLDFRSRDYRAFDSSLYDDYGPPVLDITSLPSLSPSSRLSIMIDVVSRFISDHGITHTIIYGDTDSTLAGAIASNLCGRTLIHVEAGLRSYTRIPEERNRVVSDNLSDMLFAPTLSAYRTLKRELKHKPGCTILRSGDIMKDSIQYFRNSFQPPFSVNRPYIYATIHRGENVDNELRFKSILRSIDSLSSDFEIIFSTHPRAFGFFLNPIWIDSKRFRIEGYNITFTRPLKYTHSNYLVENADFVITDSGGLQREAFYHKKRCFVVRDETEWKELVENGFSVMSDGMAFDTSHEFNTDYNTNLYGEVKNARKIAIRISRLQ